jgi:methionyl aminopeptidase
MGHGNTQVQAIIGQRVKVKFLTVVQQEVWAVSIDSEQDLQGLRHAGMIAKRTLEAMMKAAVPGITTRELDAIAGQVLQHYGAVSAPRVQYGAPVHAFISVNDALVHGLPSECRLEAGDVVKFDVTPLANGYVADAARTVVVPPASEFAQRLVTCAEAAFWAAMRVTRAGRPLNLIGKTIEKLVNKSGFRVVRELAGHGIGRRIHEAPEVLNFFHPAFHQPLSKNLVLAIEPMITAGRSSIHTHHDGWTIGTQDGSLTAHYENTVVVQRGRPLILTL